MCGWGRHVWLRGKCMVGGLCVTGGTCMARGVWFEGNAWLKGVCMAGDMHGWRYARLREVCVAEGAHVLEGTCISSPYG